MNKKTIDMMHKKGFTLIEIILVVVVIGIILGATVFVGRSYVATMQVKTEKQSFVSIYNELTATARTSNYVNGSRYESLTITIDDTGISGEVTLEAGGTTALTEYEFEKGTAVFSGSTVGGTLDVTILPYAIGCNQIIQTSGPLTVTGVDIQMISSINDDVYCFSINNSTCKLNQDRCD